MRKPKPDPQSILLLPPSLGRVEAFVECLNTEFAWFPAPTASGWRKTRLDYRPIQKELRRLVQEWRDSGPNVATLLDSDPILRSEISHFRAHLIPTKESFGRLIFEADPKTLSIRDPLETALGLFLDFLLNPYNKHLSGPCKRCGKYFVRKTDHRRAFCSKKCGLNYTASQAMKKRRQREYTERLSKVQKSIREWKRTKTSRDWKDWAARATLVSKNWITRAVKRGSLAPPA